MAKKTKAQNTYEILRQELEERCKKANIEVQEEEGMDDDETCLRLAFQAGKDKRFVYLWDDDDIKELLGVSFENYKFISGYRAIYSYTDRKVEAYVIVDPIFRTIV